MARSLAEAGIDMLLLGLGVRDVQRREGVPHGITVGAAVPQLAEQGLEPAMIVQDQFDHITGDLVDQDQEEFLSRLNAIGPAPWRRLDRVAVGDSTTIPAVKHTRKSVTTNPRSPASLSAFLVRKTLVGQQQSGPAPREWGKHDSRPRRMCAASSGRVGAWMVILVATWGAQLVIALSPEGRTTYAPTAGLPTRHSPLRSRSCSSSCRPDSSIRPWLVYNRPGGLSEADQAVIAAHAATLRTVALDSQVTPPQPSSNGETALVVVQISGTAPAEETVASVKQIREIVQADLPSGLSAQVTGGAGFTADLNLAFEGADYRLLLTTALVVAVLLLITYRSPILWLIPLIVVGLADQLTATFLKIMLQNSPTCRSTPRPAESSRCWYSVRAPTMRCC